MTLVQNRTDGEILRRVQDELEWNPRVEGAEITANSRNGIVTLSGFVDTYAHKVAAVDAVHHVVGVHDVVDELEVRSRRQAKADEEIARAVRSALEWDAWIPDDQIASTVSNGWVTLEGSVENGQQREDAMRVVERLLGVRGVTNRIAIDAPAITPAGIRSSIEKALKRRAAREAKHLAIEVREGVVTLTGTVESWAEKNALERLASYTPGVTKLVSQITVDTYR
jgi:osmotically-inducible protein OsmY